MDNYKRDSEGFIILTRKTKPIGKKYTTLDIRMNPRLLDLISENGQTVELCIAALKTDISAIAYIKNSDMISACLDKDPSLYNDINSPTDE